MTQTVHAEQISLERFPGMRSIKAEIIPPSSRVVEKAGLECPLLACAVLHGISLLLPSEVFVLASVNTAQPVPARP